MTERHGPSWARRFAEPVRRVRAKGEPAGCDRSRKGITGEQKLVAQRLPLSFRSPVPVERGSGAGSRVPDGSPVADQYQTLYTTSSRFDPRVPARHPLEPGCGRRFVGKRGHIRSRGRAFGVSRAVCAGVPSKLGYPTELLARRTERHHSALRGFKPVFQLYRPALWRI